MLPFAVSSRQEPCGPESVVAVSCSVVTQSFLRFADSAEDNTAVRAVITTRSGLPP